MGWQFPIESADLAAYLTTPGEAEPPETRKSELLNLLGSLKGEYRDGPPLISHDERWIRRVVQRAEQAFDSVEDPHANPDELLTSEFLSKCLEGLKRQLSKYRLFALTVAGRQDSKTLVADLRQQAEHVALLGRSDVLVLMTDPLDRDDFEAVRPFPATSLIFDNAHRWPGVLFWSRGGAAAFVPLKDASARFLELLHAAAQGPEVVEDLVRAYAQQEPRRKILHLSDLHFGRPESFENNLYLKKHLQQREDEIDRIVITGDLCDSPKRKDSHSFFGFLDQLQELSDRPVITIPGNHDRKFWGTFGRNPEMLPKLGYSSVHVDDEIRCVFLCFDSSRDAKGPRGVVTLKQRRDVGTAYEQCQEKRPELAEYLRVALVHHHPFTFEVREKRWLARLFGRFGLGREFFLRMEEAEEFLQWCAARRVSVLLHGHKHVPRHVTQTFELKRGAKVIWQDVTAVGCGTSLGADERPLSYNLLSWDEESRRWNAAFYADPGDYSGFREELVTTRVV